MQTSSSKHHGEMRAALAACRPGLIGVGMVTAVLTLLPVAAAIYVLMLFDVVLASRSGATLAALFGLIVVIYAAQAWLGLIRDRLLVRIAAVFHHRVAERLDGAIARSIETVASPGDGLQAARDLDAVRHAFAGRAAAAFCDIAGVPLLLLVMVLFHGWLALTLLAVAAPLAWLTARTVRSGRNPALMGTTALSDRNVSTETGLRHAELIRVLGMHARAARARAVTERRLAGIELEAADRDAMRAAIARGLRLIGVGAIFAVGAWLGIDNKASAGVIAAAALLADATLRPLEGAIAAGNAVALARLGWQRIGAVLANVPPEDMPLPLPAPATRLEVENISLAAPGTRRIVLRDVSFSLKAGDVLTVAGGSAVGKSALIRAIVGGWRTVAGQVRLDGAALAQWDMLQLGRHIGYMPQVPELFDGTVAQNIARFDPDATPDTVIAAATAAGLHDWIVRLPDGYESEIGVGGNRLSLGERQRVALARALYGDPFLLVFDEPAVYGDAVGLPALNAAIRAAQARGAIVVVSGSANATVGASNLLLILRNGQVQDFGSKDEVRNRLAAANARAPAAGDAPAPAAPAANAPAKVS